VTRHALLVLCLGGIAFGVIARACAHPAAGAGALVYAYVPWVGEPVVTPCDYVRDAWGCWLATVSAQQSITPTPTRALGPWVTSTRFPGWTATPAATVQESWTVRPAWPLAARLDLPGGAIQCSAAPMGGGVHYVASHCRGAAPWRLVVDGSPVLGWAFDPARDLGQVVTLDPPGAQTQALGSAAAGDRLTWRARGSVGAGVAMGHVWATLGRGGYTWAEADAAGARVVGLLCADAGQRVRDGDSGGGVYREDMGALVGIVVAREADDGSGDAWCGVGALAVWQGVP
jgi:hypothetical protein